MAATRRESNKETLISLRNGTMRGKRELIARTSAWLGITKVLESVPQRRILLILNYHRIGNAAETPFDSNVFSATTEEFDWQIAYLKRRFHMATLDEALGMLNGKSNPQTSVLITFDDGYLDNYTIAFPLLRSHGVQGVFFLPTAFVGTGKLPWWDEIAYIIKKSRRPQIHLTYPEPATFDLATSGIAGATMKILWLLKRPAARDTERFIAGLEEACGVPRPEPGRMRCFLNWEEAREMQSAGMAFGSHTHMHEILTKLPAEGQQRELAESRTILERELKQPIQTLAYPVGGLTAFSGETKEALRATGYRAAFSFYGGTNTPGQIDAFDIRRFGVDGQSRPRLRLQTALAASSGSRWL